MGEQVRKQRARRAEPETATEETAAETKTAEDLKAETDALLDEIDGVLEENAEEFVRSFRQSGGE